MKARFALGILLIFLLLLTGSVWSQKAGHPNTTGWKNLLDPSLANAVYPPGSWVVENGVLVAKTGDTLFTRDSYGDFILDLEFKVSPGANSGVFLRTGDVKDILSAFEIQIHESTDGAQYGMVGALYNCLPPSKPMQKPAGQWNRYTITFQGSNLSLVFNGEQVLNADLNNWKEAGKNPDGTKNKFTVALKDYARKGPIGLQGLHGKEQAPVWFRNIKIKTL